MYAGVQGIGTSRHELQFLVRHGVTHMDATVEDNEVDTLTRHREAAAAEGVELEMIHIGLPRSITLARDPERDRDLDEVCRWIENAGRAGLRGLNYNFCVLDHQRTPSTPGRGGTSYSTFRLSEYDNDTLSEAGEVSRDECFERAQYFLERVIPVAEEYRVQMACHLDDPPAPVLRGVERWNWPVMEGLTRFSELVESDWHGFNFCCGVASEGLEDPGRELYDIVRRFGQRRKLFNIHFRNIKGGPARLPGGLARRGRRGHARGGAGAARGRLPVHADARPRARSPGRSLAPGRLWTGAPGLGLPVRLHHRHDPGGLEGELTPPHKAEAPFLTGH